MTVLQVTYQDYQSHGGKVCEEKFDESLFHATAAVREIIGFNEPRNEHEEEAYKAAVCAAVDVDQRHGGSGGLGEGGSGVRIGSFSADFGSGMSASHSNTYDQDMLRAIKPHLIGTSLLYQVIV